MRSDQATNRPNNQPPASVTHDRCDRVLHNIYFYTINTCPFKYIYFFEKIIYIEKVSYLSCVMPFDSPSERYIAL